MATANDILRIAQAEVGTYATAVKRCKYNTWYYNADVSGPGYDWCAVFVMWVFNQARALDLIPVKSANCGALAKGFYDRGQLKKSGYQVGDIVFFHWDNDYSNWVPGVYSLDHVGIIKSVNSNGSYTTIEGNTGSSAYGAVMERTRYASQISCTVRPNYSGYSSTPPSPSSPSSGTPDVTYRVKTQNRGWLPEVKNLSDYAGIENDPITDVAIKVSNGSVWYQVHNKGGGWLPKVTGYNINDYDNGYAGSGRQIDAIRVYYTTPASITNGGRYYYAKYRVSPIGTTNYYDYQIDDSTANGQDGYAGAFGRSMDKFQIYLA